MTDSPLPLDPRTTALTEYKPTTELIRRGLDDALHALAPRPKILRVPIDCQTVQLAVDSASEGDIIEILPGVYRENVTIKKGLTVRGASGCERLQLQWLLPHPNRGRYVLVRGASECARLQSREEDKPVFFVDLEYGNLRIENIGFLGKAGAWWMPQIGIRIARGEVLLKSCQFEGWQTADESADVDGAYWEDYWRHYRPSSAIVVSGNSSVLEARGCQSADSDGGIDLSGDARATISDCMFVGVWDGGIRVRQSSVVSRGNSMVGGGWLISDIGERAKVDSQYDSLVDADGLLSSGSSLESIVTFSHATIDSYHLVGVSVGQSRVHPNPDGGWAWRAPRMLMTDSIVRLRSPEHLTSVFPLDGPREWGLPDFNIWDYIEFSGRNLLCAPPDFPGPDPRFGDVQDGQLSLRLGSPAIGAASDGTNLGAWQGTRA